MQCACVLGHFSLFVPPWTVLRQVPLSIEFSKQVYWSTLPCSSLDHPDPGIEPVSPASPALAGRLFTTSTNCEAQK